MKSCVWQPVQAQKKDAELLYCAYKSLKKFFSWDIGISNKIPFFLLYAELLMICCGDIELNPGPEMCYEYFFKVSEKYKNNLSFVHLLRCIWKTIAIEVFYQRHGRTRYYWSFWKLAYSYIELSSWNVAPKTHELFSCDRSSTKCKMKGTKTISTYTQYQTLIRHLAQSFMGITPMGHYNLDYLTPLD